MTGTFLYLTVRSMWNRAARRLRRLREPRYLVGLAVGLGYLYFAVLRNQIRATRRSGDLFADPEFVSALPAILAVGGLLLWAFMLLAWLWPSSEPPLKFSGAEVQFFYPAPVTRRQILNYKLLRSQTAVLFGVAVAALFSGAATAGRWTFLVGGFVAFSTIRLHLLGIGLTRASFGAAASGVPLRGWIPPLVMGVLSSLLVAPLVVQAGALASLGFPAGAARLLTLVQARPASIGLWPFAALIAPILSPPGLTFLAALLPALALFALNYWWVLQSDAVLEQAAVSAEKQVARGTRRHPAPVARRPPFRLASFGRPEYALLWKNLILLGRYASPRMIVRMLVPIVILSVAASSSRAGLTLAPLALLLAGFFVVVGPYMIRNDLRHDLRRLAVLKTWPVPGWSLVLGELLAPTVVLTTLAWTSLAVAAALSGSLGWRWASLGDRLALALAAGILAPVLVASQLLIQNAAVVLFPGWIPVGPNRPRGIEAMGQQMLMMAATLLALVVGVLPAAAVAVGAGLVLYRLIGFAGLVPAGVLFATVLLLEAVLVVLSLGRILERTDPTQVEEEG